MNPQDKLNQIVDEIKSKSNIGTQDKTNAHIIGHALVEGGTVYKRTPFSRNSLRIERIDETIVVTDVKIEEIINAQNNTSTEKVTKTEIARIEIK